jgi:hypothetical protein
MYWSTLKGPQGCITYGDFYLKQWYLPLILLLIMISRHLGASEAIGVGYDFESIPVGLGIEYYEDVDGDKSFSDIQAGNILWKTSEMSQLSFGFSDSAYWFKAHIINDSANHGSLFLDIKNPFLDRVDMYVKRLFDLSHTVVGDTQPIEERPVKHPSLLLPFEMEPYDELTLYVRVESEGALRIPMILRTQSNLIETNYNNNALSNLFYGVLLSISLYHILVYLAIKDQLYLLYSFFYISIIGVYVSLDGVPNILFWPEHPEYTNYFLLLSIGLSIFFPCYFSNGVLNLDQDRPRWGKLMRAIGVLGLSGYWAYSYFQNKNLINHVAEKTEAAEEVVADVSRYEKNLFAPMKALNTVRALPTGYEEQANDEQHHWLQMGMYQGRKLGQEASDAYGRLLYKTFLPRLLVQVESALYEQRADAEYLYDTLRIYLMLSDPARLDKAAVTHWVEEDWQRTLPRDIRKDEYQNLQNHLSALLDYMPKETPLQANEELVQSVRTLLSTLPPAKRFYFRLKQEGEQNNDLEPYRLVDGVGSEAAYLFQFTNGQPITSEISGFFTKAGYQEYFIEKRDDMIERFLSDEWVMGKEYGLESVGMSAEQLQDQIEALYLDDYLLTWQRYLESLDFAQMNNPRETLSILRELSRKDSPIIALIKSISEHTSARAFSLLGGISDKTGLDVPSEVTDAAGVDPNQAIPSEVADSNAIPDLNRPNPVVEYFEDLNAQVEGDDGQSPPVEDTLRMLDQLYVYMNAMNTAMNRGEEAMKALKDGSASAAIQDLDIMAERQPKPLSTLLSKVSNKAKLQTASDAKNYIERQWNNEVARHCKNMIEGRYPFNRNSSREATFDDVSAYFGPGGILENYLNESVIDYIDTSLYLSRVALTC